MILEFAVENFRSIKSRQTFSMVAESTKTKGKNVFEVDLPKGDSVRLLNTAMIYGANASGKSNFIKALGSLIQLIRHRITGADKPVRGYDPFLFDPKARTSPTIFELTFIFESIKYRYKVVFDQSHISEEELEYYPKGQSNRVYTRQGSSNDLLHKIKFGKDFGNKEIEVFKNQLGITKFGIDTPHILLTKLYVYFMSIEINNAINGASDNIHVRRISQRITTIDKNELFNRLERLLKVADTGINSIDMLDNEESIIRLVRNDNGALEQVLEKKQGKKMYSLHTIYENGLPVGTEKIDFHEESDGTKALFWRGGLILEKLHLGGILVFDELDNSLHPKLVKFLVKMFSNPLTNPKNAQLIFATHEVTLLDSDLFRTDQIWFVEKNKFGESELFSAQDFEGVRENVPFDKWYVAGKFGGLPKIGEIESVFDHA